MSPVLFCLYIDGLLTQLLQAGIRCFIIDNLFAALVYVIDIVLFVPLASALCTALASCENYANDHSVMFNAIKSRCLVVLPNHC